MLFHVKFRYKQSWRDLAHGQEMQMFKLRLKRA